MQIGLARVSQQRQPAGVLGLRFDQGLGCGGHDFAAPLPRRSPAASIPGAQVALVAAPSSAKAFGPKVTNVRRCGPQEPSICYSHPQEYWGNVITAAEGQQLIHGLVRPRMRSTYPMMAIARLTAI